MSHTNLPRAYTLCRNLKQFVLAVTFCVSISRCLTADAGNALVASEGQAKFKVVVSPTATDTVKKHVADLAAMLEKISGAKFEIVAGDGQDGIAVGTAADFPQAPVNGRLDSQDVMRGDEYIIKTHAKGIWLVGATDVAAGHAVWDFIYRMGYRQYFPGKTWEIIPTRKKIEVSLDVFSSPSYITRDIWYQFGGFNDYEFNTWCLRNRTVSSFVLKNAHMSQTIEWDNKQAFKDHPEYYALVKGVRGVGGGKLCISNPGLRKLFAEEIIRRFEKNPKVMSLSIEPQDGGGWCECEECAKMGSKSDRQVTLGNEVAKEVVAKFGKNKYLGMLAYYEHAAPPAIKVSPQVLVTACTRFGPPVEETLEGWHKQGATMGVYDYYSVNTWHRDLPGFPGGSRLDYIAQSIPSWYRLGVRFFSAESGENWGPCGFGYFLASRLLWDVNEASRVKELRSEFINLCFRKAAKPMDEFYSLIDGTNRGLQLDDLVGQMYRRLDSARKLEADTAVRARIDDLIAYTRYVELFRAYDALKKSKSPHRKEFEDVILYVFRIRASGMVHGVALVRDLPGYDKEVTVPIEAAISGSKDAKFWQNSAPPLSSEEISKILADGIAANPVLPFQAVPYSMELVPAGKALGLPSVPAGNYDLHGDGVSWYAWLEPGKERLKVSGAGDFQFKLYAVDKEKGDTLVSNATIKAAYDKVRNQGAQDIELKSPKSGLHRVVVSGPDSWALRQQSEEAGDYYAIPASTNFNSPSSLYFYVPKGTAIVAGKYSGHVKVMKDDTGKVVLDFSTLKDEIASKKGAVYFTVPVPAGRDGTLWKMEGLVLCHLYTVPPYYALSAEELVLPKEVVERDAKK